MNSSILSPFTALTLKLVGVIFILSSLLDYIALALPFDPFKDTWQIKFVSQIVDRGIIPMIGITLLIVGYWIESITSGQKSLDLKLPAFILSTFLGLLFLLLIPVHIKNLNQINTTALTQIQQTADQAESRIQQEFENLDKITKDPKALEQLKTQLTQIDTVINSGTYQGQQLTSQQIDQLKAQKQQYQSLQELAKKPAELKKRKEELQTQLRDQKQERENQTKITNFKEGLRIGLSSLMLAIGYTVIGWFGLRSSMSTDTVVKRRR